jgi:hypothetical protein
LTSAALPVASEGISVVKYGSNSLELEWLKPTDLGSGEDNDILQDITYEL